MVYRTVIVLALAALPAAASAQYIGGRPPEPPPPPAAGTLETPEAALARNVRLLAINPRHYEALLGAGRSALRLGDAQAAIGFFGRAEEVNSAHWAPKAGQGSALAQMGEGAAALGLFEQARSLGATQALVALDRGLALDLLARQAEAQADYRALLGSADEVEARRRLALSLAISGRKSEALTILDPLIARADLPARRARAFILALGGDLEGARRAIAAVMPGVAGGFDPFLRRLPLLAPGQKAAAVHLGMMPAEGAALAALEAEPPASAAPPTRIAAGPPVRADPRPNASRLAEIESSLSSLPGTATPPAESATPVPPAPRPVFDRAPPAPRPIVERTARRAQPALERTLASRPPTVSPMAEGRAATRTTSRQGAATTRNAAAEERPGRAAAPSGSRIYVQIAGGQNAERMDREFARIRARKASLFRGRQPLVSEVRGWSRLLVGPFKDQEKAQEFVNDLQAAGLEGFAWTAPAGTRFERLAAK